MFIPQYVSCVMCHVSRVTCHVSPVTCHLSHDKRRKLLKTSFKPLGPFIFVKKTYSLEKVYNLNKYWDLFTPIECRPLTRSWLYSFYSLTLAPNVESDPPDLWRSSWLSAAMARALVSDGHVYTVHIVYRLYTVHCTVYTRMRHFCPKKSLQP